MLSNSALLYQQAKDHPDDLTLLCAYADCLEEEDRPAEAALVRELVALTTEQVEAYGHLSYVRRRDWLRWRLRLRDVQLGDRLACDEEGRLYPTGESHMVGIVMSHPDGDGRVLVHFPHASPYERRTMKVEMVRRVGEGVEVGSGQ